MRLEAWASLQNLASLIHFDCIFKEVRVQSWFSLAQRRGVECDPADTLFFERSPSLENATQGIQRSHSSAAGDLRSVLPWQCHHHCVTVARR